MCYRPASWKRARSRLAIISGPESTGEHSPTHNLGGISLWIGDSGLMKQRIEPDDLGRAHLSALAPGRYTLRAYPDDLLLEPDFLDLSVGEPGPIGVRWRVR